VAVQNFIAPASLPTSATQDVEVTCGVRNAWSCPTLLRAFRLGAKGQSFIIEIDFQLTFASMLLW